MKASITLAADSPYFAGHFPGRPILPGVIELALMAEAAAHVSGRDDPVHTIPFARLRHLVVPGDRLELSARTMSGGRIRVDMTRGDTVVANAALELGALRPASRRRSAPNVRRRRARPRRSAPAAAPADALRDAIAGGGGRRSRLHRPRPGGVFARHRRSAPALAAIEGGAAAVGACGAGDGGDAAPRTGYLVALRDIVFFATHVPADTDLLASIGLSPPRRTHALRGVEHGPRRILRGPVATVLA
jgi:hypothetical protein